MPFLYDTATAAYHLGIRLAAPFSTKASLWLKDRRNMWAALEAAAPQLQGCLWMHCASAGEFEQGLPVLEAIRKERPEMPVLLTFFSPSGLHAKRHHPMATHVAPLPADGRANAARLLALIKPRAAVFVRYEFWHHHLHALKAAGVPTFLLSAIFRPGQPFFRWYGATHRAMLRCFTGILAQDQRSVDLMRTVGITTATLTGDTRYDRVLAIVEADERLPMAEAFAGDAPTLLCGSTWPADERLLLDAFQRMGTAPKCIIAPHEMHPDQLKAVEAQFPKPLVRWSELEGGDSGNVAAMLGPERSGTLLVDRMGLLSRLYRHGSVAYVGGGFGTGIHSVLEPAAWGRPVVFGPNHAKFPEARGLMEAGAGWQVDDATQLSDLLIYLCQDTEARERAGKAAAAFVHGRGGATPRAVQRILPFL